MVQTNFFNLSGRFAVHVTLVFKTPYLRFAVYVTRSCKLNFKGPYLLKETR
jgi:hypothetical protein